jgi:hypothetical protein
LPVSEIFKRKQKMKLNIKEKLSNTFNTLSGKNGRAAAIWGAGAGVYAGGAVALAVLAVAAPPVGITAAVFACLAAGFAGNSHQAAQKNAAKKGFGQ